MSDGQYPKQILTTDSDCTINDHAYYLRQAGYDVDAVWYIKFDFTDYEYAKVFHYARNLMDWRNKERDSVRTSSNAHEAKTTFLDKEIVLYFCCGNCYYMGHIAVGQLIFVLVNKDDGDMSLLRDFIKCISSLPKHKTIDGIKRITLFDPTITGYVEILGREISTVYMPHDQKAKIIKDVESFLSEETTEFNYKYGIPDKLVYLLYGLPGTGKTSLVKAIATTFNLTITTLKLTNINDEMLRNFLLSVPRDSIILLDDIDSAFRTVTQTAVHGGHLSFSAILEMLDGMNIPNKRLIFMTCNDTKIFDVPAMRAGRIDRIVKFGPMTTETIVDMLDNFFSNQSQLGGNNQSQVGADTKVIIENIATKLDGNITPAELQTMILEAKCLTTLTVKTDQKMQEIRDRYSKLNQQNQSMYSQYYGQQYSAYAKPTAMYT